MSITKAVSEGATSIFKRLATKPKQITLHHYVYDGRGSVSLIDGDDELGKIKSSWKAFDRSLEKAADNVDEDLAPFQDLVDRWQLALADAADRVAKATRVKVVVVDEYGVKLDAKDRKRIAKAVADRAKPAKPAKAAKSTGKKPPKGVPEGATWSKEWNCWEHGELDAKGKRTGLWKGYRPDASVVSEATWKDGVLNGPYRRFHLDRTLSEEGSFVNGRIKEATHHRSKKPTDENFPDGTDTLVWKIIYKFNPKEKNPEWACKSQTRFLANGMKCDYDGNPIR